MLIPSFIVGNWYLGVHCFMTSRLQLFDVTRKIQKTYCITPCAATEIKFTHIPLVPPHSLYPTAMTNMYYLVALDTY